MLTEFEINRLAGKKRFALRQTLGISRAVLGKEIGVSGQQIHKYEIGVNRLDANKLYRLAALFEVTPVVFFPAADAKQVHEPLPPASIKIIKMINKISEEHHESLYTILRELVRIIQQSEAEPKA